MRTGRISYKVATSYRPLSLQFYFSLSKIAFPFFQKLIGVLAVKTVQKYDANMGAVTRTIIDAL